MCFLSQLSSRMTSDILEIGELSLSLIVFQLRRADEPQYRGETTGGTSGK